MSKFFPQKKKLLEEVFEKASNRTPEKSFSGILKFLEQDLQDEHKVLLSYKSFETYYLTVVENENDYNIKTTILDSLCKYIDYNSFSEYCAEWKTVEHTITNHPSKIIVHVVNKPLLQMPEFLTKQSNLGILGVLLLGGLFAGNKILEDEAEISPQIEVTEKASPQSQIPVKISESPDKKTETKTKTNTNDIVKEKECMYWDDFQYVQTFCSDYIENRELIAFEQEKAKLMKNTRPDTLTVENAFGKVWYLKFENNVEFFNQYGEHPKNGKTLKNATKYILTKYGKQETPE